MKRGARREDFLARAIIRARTTPSTDCEQAFKGKKGNKMPFVKAGRVEST